ncbi:MAG: hypothetical protein ACYC3F_01065 [Gemmatimonadaceae bacterium]
MRDRRRTGRWLGPRLELLHGRMQDPAARAATERALRSAGHGGLVLMRVYEILHAQHCESIAYRRDAPVHIMTEGHRRYWRELLALESLAVVMTLAELLASEHALVREATLLALSE